jgi:low affinity Fe/Cu permease
MAGRREPKFPHSDDVAQVQTGGAALDGSKNHLERLSEAVCSVAGSSPAFGLALLVVIVWAATGPLFGYSDTWQLVINTGTTIVTFLMVFLIQRSQNKESLAVQLKLNEIVAAVEGASNRLIDVEKLSETDLATLHAHYEKLVRLAQKDGSLTESHSVEDAESRHVRKAGHAPRPPARKQPARR